MRSVSGLVDEMVVVDAGSTDDTAALCEGSARGWSVIRGAASGRRSASPRRRRPATGSSASTPTSGSATTCAPSCGDPRRAAAADALFPRPRAGRLSAARNAGAVRPLPQLHPALQPDDDALLRFAHPRQGRADRRRRAAQGRHPAQELPRLRPHRRQDDRLLPSCKRQEGSAPSHVGFLRMGSSFPSSSSSTTSCAATSSAAPTASPTPPRWRSGAGRGFSF